jgi:hypothetical protein
MKAGKVVLITTGSLAALLAAGLLAGAVWALNGNTDSSGYVVTGDHRAQTVTHAFASADLDVDSDFDWILDRGPQLRVTGESSEPLFIGIARTGDVERYLAGVARPGRLPQPARTSGRQACREAAPRRSTGTPRAVTGRSSS